MKKYFLKDTTLKNIDDDKFRYQDYANNLRKILECNNAPFNIAIIGKWGLGKSSLINMALAPLMKKEKEYLICNINAWKYEKDEIGKAFLKEIYENINKEKIFSFKFFHKEYDKLVKDNFSKESKKDKKQNWSKLIIFMSISIAISLGVFFLYCLISNKFYKIDFENNLFVQSSFLRYCKNIGTILIIPLFIWFGKLFMDKIDIPINKNYEISFPLETQADYEIYLSSLLDKYSKKNKGQKIVIVVDDLDRLSAEKIVEALDALKIFMEYKEFIFIVPFDDEILKNALDRNKLNQINGYIKKYDGDMVLDKLFQYKIYLPELIKSDMRNYAFNICKEDCEDFINEFFDKNQEQFEKIVGKILIHNNVSTPRQVKKIINTFIENVMIARDREYAKRVSSGFSSEEKGLETIAIISVLQSDYNSFYDILFKNGNAIKEILQIHRNEVNEIQFYELSEYFYKNQSTFIIKKEYEALINFLSFTENLGYKNLTPYLYLAQSEAGVIVGDQKQQDFMSAIESCNFITAKRFLKEMPVLIDVLLEQLKYVETPMMGNMVVSAIECWDIIENNKKIQLAQTLNERIKSISLGKMDFRYDLINFKNLLELSKEINSDEYNDLVEYSLDICNEENKERIINKIICIRESLASSCFNKYVTVVKKWIDIECLNVNAIIEFVNSERREYIAKTYGKNYIKRISNYIVENSEFSDDIIKQFGSIIELYLNDNSIVEIEDLIEPCYEYPIMHTILDKSISKNDYRQLQNSKKIANIIVSIGVDKLKDESSFSILSKLSYEIDEEDKEQYDNFFVNTIEKNIFAKLILAFAEKNSLENLKKTIQELIISIFESEEYSEDAKLLVKMFSKEQSQQFWKKIEEKCSPSCSSYNIVLDIINILMADQFYIESLHNLMSDTIIENLSNYYDKNAYRKFAQQAVCKFKDYLTEEEITKFSGFLMKALSIDTEGVLNGYRSIHLQISENEWCENTNELLNYISKSTYSIIYDIIISRISLFNEQNENLNRLQDFLVDYIEMSKNPDEVIEQLGNKFKEKISDENLDKLIYKLLDLDINIENIGMILSNYIDNVPINKIVKIIVKQKEYKDKLLNLFSYSQNYASDIILKKINEIQESLEKNNLLLLIQFYCTEINKENVIDFINIIRYIEKSYIEKDVYTIILQAINMVSSQIIEGQKSTFVEVITDIFKETTSEDVKKQSAILIKDKKLAQKAKSMLNKDEQTLYKSYIN